MMVNIVKEQIVFDDGHIYDFKQRAMLQCLSEKNIRELMQLKRLLLKELKE